LASKGEIKNRLLYIYVPQAEAKYNPQQIFDFESDTILDDIETFFKMFPKSNPNRHLIFEALCKDASLEILINLHLNPAEASVFN
jgi:hypothetical protein